MVRSSRTEAVDGGDRQCSRRQLMLNRQYRGRRLLVNMQYRGGGDCD